MDSALPTVIDKYYGPGLRYEDGRLGLACWKDVKAFARYLRKAAAKYPASTTCYYSMGWHKENRSPFILVISFLSTSKRAKHRPWERGTLKLTTTPIGNRVYRSSYVLSQAADRLERWYRRVIRSQHKIYKAAVERARDEKKQELHRKMEELKRVEEQLELETSKALQLMEETDKWQLREEEDEDKNEEQGAGNA